jgi:uncharacterized membrane protein YgcG
LFAQGFTVQNYTVDIYINQAGYFDVVENYDLNFDIRKHGIYRKIQTDYDMLTSEGKKEKRTIKISNIEVPDHKFDVPLKVFQRLEGGVNIKIGDPDFTVMGSQHYEIKYRVANAFLYEKEYTRFYWNIKPNGWYSSFYKINFRVHVPENVSLSEEDCFVYSGPIGETSISRDFATEYRDGVFEGSSKDGFVSLFGDSVTVLMNLPPGSIKEVKPFWPFWTKYGWILIIGVVLFAFYLVWLKYGKDDRVISTTSYYPPEGIDPAMAGFLINDKSDSSDLISLIPYWGSMGLLKVEEIPKKGWFSSNDTKLTKLKDLPNGVPRYQKEIFEGLFGSDPSNEVLVSSLKDSFYTTMNLAKTFLKGKGQKYYIKKSRKVKGISCGVLAVLMLLLFPVVFFFWGIIAAIVTTVAFILLLILNTYMIKKNPAGNDVFSELKGFKQFIKVAEENKLKMLLKDDPTYFETTMGYALAFGMFEKWAKKFDALSVEPPSWYSSSTGTALTMAGFSNSFSSSMSSTQSTMVSSPSSSSSGGGGSSGGGFGGGGGGSW